MGDPNKWLQYGGYNKPPDGKFVINIISLGTVWCITPSVPLDSEDYVMTIDVRWWTDPYQEYPNLSGLDENIQNHLRNQPGFKDWLKSLTDLLVIQTKLLIDRDKNSLNILMVCRGGYSRSVAITEILHRELTNVFGNTCHINSKHLTLPAASEEFGPNKE